MAGNAVQPTYTNGAQAVDLICIVEDTTFQRLRYRVARHTMITYRLLHDRYCFLRKSRAGEQVRCHFSAYLRVIPTLLRVRAVAHCELCLAQCQVNTYHVLKELHNNGEK